MPLIDLSRDEENPSSEGLIARLRAQSARRKAVAADSAAEGSLRFMVRMGWLTPQEEAGIRRGRTLRRRYIEEEWRDCCT